MAMPGIIKNLQQQQRVGELVKNFGHIKSNLVCGAMVSTKIAATIEQADYTQVIILAGISSTHLDDGNNEKVLSGY